eukprot:3769228-Prymnesium_polylepis.1
MESGAPTHLRIHAARLNDVPTMRAHTDASQCFGRPATARAGGSAPPRDPQRLGSQSARPHCNGGDSTHRRVSFEQEQPPSGLGAINRFRVGAVMRGGAPLAPPRLRGRQGLRA